MHYFPACEEMVAVQCVVESHHDGSDNSPTVYWKVISKYENPKKIKC